MTLKEYIIKNSTVPEFSKIIGIAPTSMNRYINGARCPRPEIAFKIVKATGGDVTFESLYKSGVTLLPSG